MKKKMKLRWKFVVPGIVAIAALGFIGVRAFGIGASYYYEVGELVSQQISMVDRTLRVNGQVATGSIEQNGLDLKFTITDGTQNLPVVYKGAVPDSFRAGGDITVEGRLNEAGVFEASILMPKCPSKYVPV